MVYSVENRILIEIFANSKLWW